jgi:hypothetical protein
MAGVIAHNKAIVSSANARIVVILISVLLPLTTRNKDNTPTTMLTRVDDDCCDGDHSPKANEDNCLTRLMTPIQRFGEPWSVKNSLTPECVRGLILLMVQSKGLRSGTLANRQDQLDRQADHRCNENSP